VTAARAAVNQPLSGFMAMVAEGYTPRTTKSVFGNYSRWIHTSDVASNLNLDYALNFVRLNAGFIVELAK
jgi:hypothetical protein